MDWKECWDKRKVINSITLLRKKIKILLGEIKK